MNQKDCEQIGYVLSEFRVPYPICEALFALDPRIEHEYTGYLEIRGISDAVDERAEELAIQANGKDWSIKRHPVKPYKECRRQAMEEIYGEEEANFRLGREAKFRREAK